MTNNLKITIQEVDDNDNITTIIDECMEDCINKCSECQFNYDCENDENEESDNDESDNEESDNYESDNDESDNYESDNDESDNEESKLNKINDNNIYYIKHFLQYIKVSYLFMNGFYKSVIHSLIPQWYKEDINNIIIKLESILLKKDN